MEMGRFDHLFCKHGVVVVLGGVCHFCVADGTKMTLEDLENQVARTQGRELGVTISLLNSLSDEVKELGDAQFDLYQNDDRDGKLREALKLEIGDVLNIITAIAIKSGFTLQEVAEANDAKLRERWPDGHPDLKG